ncbi:MAG: signal peptidase I [Clostridia bacterium]|nr:MAG: signal peptidase I [Clostridia bacterium]
MEDTRQAEEAQKSSGWLDLLEAVIIALALAMVIRLFLFEPFVIPSGSMEPTLQPGDRIIVSKLSYRFSEPQREDVIVFRYPPNPRLVYIKRLVAMGGDTVRIEDNRLYVNGQPVPEQYLPDNVYMHDFGPVTIPPGSFFVLGDNRNNSEDSRVWGLLPEGNVLGKAVLLFWPPGRFRLIGP